MAKLKDYQFRAKDQELTDFKDDVRTIFNNGKAQFQVLPTVPVFAGLPGEISIYQNGTDGRLYIYMGTSWNLALLFTADAA